MRKFPSNQEFEYGCEYKINFPLFYIQIIGTLKKMNEPNKSQKQQQLNKTYSAHLSTNEKYSFQKKRESFQFQSIVIPTINLSKFACTSINLKNLFLSLLPAPSTSCITQYIIWDSRRSHHHHTPMKKRTTTTDNKTVADTFVMPIQTMIWIGLNSIQRGKHINVHIQRTITICLTWFAFDFFHFNFSTVYKLMPNKLGPNTSHLKWNWIL